jgi:hypothetical protein
MSRNRMRVNPAIAVRRGAVTKTHSLRSRPEQNGTVRIPDASTASARLPIAVKVLKNHRPGSVCFLGFIQYSGSTSTGNETFFSTTNNQLSGAEPLLARMETKAEPDVR